MQFFSPWARRTRLVYILRYPEIPRIAFDCNKRSNWIEIQNRKYLTLSWWLSQSLSVYSIFLSFDVQRLKGYLHRPINLAYQRARLRTRFLFFRFKHFCTEAVGVMFRSVTEIIIGIFKMPCFSASGSFEVNPRRNPSIHDSPSLNREKTCR